MENLQQLQEKHLHMQKQIEELERQNAALLKEVKHKEDLLEHYQQQFRLLQKKMFGSSSEKSIVMPEQLSLFNEAEITADEKTVEPTVEEITYTRRKAKITKEENLENLVTEVIVHDIDEVQKTCPDCDSQMQEIKTENRFELKIIPAKVEVIKHITPVYACNSCDGKDFNTCLSREIGFLSYRPCLSTNSRI